MDQDKIKDNLKKLENSPLFALSLGSKELFHSNFLYWLINAGVLGTKEDGKEITGKELFCDIIREITGISINPKENWVTRREKMKFDLSLWEVKKDKKGQVKKDRNGQIIEDKCILVIENKMKSVPSVKQIVEYIQKFKVEEVPQFVLLTLMKNFPDRKKIEEPTKEQLKEWKINGIDCKIVIYENLVEKLKDYIKNLQFSSPYYESLISDYVEFVNILSKLNYDDSGTDNHPMMFGLDEEFNKLRILQLIQAIRVGELYSLLHKQFDKNEKYKDIKFNTGYGQNGGAFIEILYAPGKGRDAYTGKEKEKEDKKGYEEPTHRSIGIQIQENRYSHFVCPLDYTEQLNQKISDEDKNKQDKNWVKNFNGFFADSNKLFSNLLNNKEYPECQVVVEDNNKDKLIYKNNSSKNKILLSFESKKEGYHPRFAYQYAIIPEQADYKFIIDQIVKDINDILNNYRDNQDALKIKR